ncbi:MAG: hypothetical protein LBR26_12600 [Prevotella sp.]|nr:hypothetical protein [Prevotella sp.]
MFGNYPVRRYIQSSGCFFPAAGYRYVDGGLRYVGHAADHWSSSPSNSDGYNLDCFGNDVLPAKPNSRAHGFPVRCVKEFILVFY